MDRRSQLKKGSALPVSASSDGRVCVTKPKTKERRRRFRSLADIYMNSPRCTLEDVEKLSKMTEQDYPKTSNRLNGKSGELGPSKKRKYKSMKISDSVVGKKLPSESGEAEIRENHHVELVSSKRNSTGKEKQPHSTSSSIKLGKEKMCSSTGSIRAGDHKQPNPNPSSRSVSQIPIAVGPLGNTCLPAASCIAAADSPMSGKYTNNSNSAVIISSIPDQESQSIVVAAGHITSSDEKMQSSVVPTNSIINATGLHATEYSTGPSSSSSTGARKLRLFGFNIDPTATQTCQVTNIDNGLHNNQIDFMSINGGGQDAGGHDHLPHHTIIAAQPNMINEFGRLSAAASPVPRASVYLPLVAAPTNINDTVGYYNYPLPAAAAAPVLNHRVFMNGLSGFVPPGVAPGNIIIFQCLPAQSFTSHQLGSFNSQAVTIISPTPWNSGVPASSSSRPIRPTPRRFLPPPSSA